MSVQAMAWVLEDAPDLPAHLVGTLLGLANHAGASGDDAYPSQATLAWYARKSERSVRNDLAELERLGLIRRGNQQRVADIREDKRPVVWDLAVERKRPKKATTGSPLPGGSEVPGGSAVPSGGKSTTERPEVGYRAGGSGLPTNRPEPSVEPSLNRAAPTTELVVANPDHSQDLGEPTAQTLTREWIDHCQKKPPRNVVGQVAKQLGAMLAEGIDYDDVRRGLALWASKGLHPSTLPSVVNEAMNGGGPVARPSTTDQRVAAGLALAAKYAQEGR